MKIIPQQKVYKIMYGTTPFEKDDRKKPLKNVDNLNIKKITIIAEDVYDALQKTLKILLGMENEYKKEDDEQIFVQSVELINIIDDLD